MLLLNFRSSVLRVVFPTLLASACLLRAHVVPNMTVEANFTPDGSYTLTINVDPRTFLAADPTTLPPVPATWFREQTPEQTAATRQKAEAYLSGALRLLFDGQTTPLPACNVQAIDGADNTPLKPDTQEVHLLAVAKGRQPEHATGFQIDFAKDANTTLILLQSLSGKTDPRPQVLFPGETSRMFQLQTTPQPPVAVATAPGTNSGSIWVLILAGLTLAALIQGWRLLNRHRHHHRAHRKPSSNDVNN